jgi:hypothetical protein
MPRPYTDKILIDGSGFGHLPRGMTFSTTPASYEQAVADTLDFIQATARPPCVGEIVLEEVLFNTGNRKLKIVPRPEDLPSASMQIQVHNTNAEVDAANWQNASAKGVRTFAGHMDDPTTPNKDERFDLNSFVGTGKGSDATVFFTPIDGPSAAPGTKGLCGEANDDLLLHELIHAIRIMQGKDNPVPTDDKHYDNQEEWLAILVTNVYMSEKGDWPLRAHHHDYSAMRVSSRGFLEVAQNLHMMMVFAGEQASLFNSIAARVVAQPQRPPADPTAAAQFAAMPNANVPVREFNPIRLFRDNARMYMKRIVGDFTSWVGAAGTGGASGWSKPLPTSPPGMWGPGLQD